LELRYEYCDHIHIAEAAFGIVFIIFNSRSHAPF
jgi:hypothetical protein